ncbi:MAG: hypothetical protein C0605_17160 [Hyphomicrobiales bacterium]|nr:MAG: hypothetical protein C0605_17160 [Hyphomicrobiales bacterium]
MTVIDETYRFRALTINGKRHGIRLENRFWTVLEEIAKEQMRPVADIIAEVDGANPDTKNLTSLMRLYALQWLSENLAKLRARTDIAKTGSVIQACPSPTFILSEKKKLHSFNAAFVRYVQMRFAQQDMDKLSNQLRLQIDTPTEELILQLKSAGKVFIHDGFTLGMQDRRIRGTINIYLSSAWQEDLIICHVLD